ncbi:hypothetical protein RchiOBHm_Chr1g0329701 [Rosa chinensis]|uniref:Uncharacterized protein n=1 Tax=Rosa chinensis TaxID=74649 RepID=A0A2P6SB48_ROSCH|nr:hypothetical protein RchiOBHm_Chr1g0329701 [Rosa chinensis]
MLPLNLFKISDLKSSLSRYPSSSPTTSTVKTAMTRPCHRTPRLGRRRSRSRRNRRSLRLPWLRRRGRLK